LPIEEIRFIGYVEKLGIYRCSFGAVKLLLSFWPHYMWFLRFLEYIGDM